MRTVGARDAALLAADTRAAPAHMSELALVEATTPEGRLVPAQIRGLIEARLDLLPGYRRCLRKIPLDFAAPLWIEDPEFDLDFHVRHIAVPPPGDDFELASLVARLSVQPLDRSRPLWELYFIEGLESGAIALLSKVHPGAIDARSGTELLAVLLDVKDEPAQLPTSRRRWCGDREPGDIELLARAAIGLPAQPRQWLTNAARIASLRPLAAIPGAGLVRSLGEGAATPPLNPGPARLPATPFGGALSPRRAFAFGSLPLDDVLEVQEALASSIDEIVVAAATHALRSWLSDREVLPQEPLEALVPVVSGDRLATIHASLPTPIADPLERLGAVHDTFVAAGDQLGAIPLEELREPTPIAPSAVAARAARCLYEGAAGGAAANLSLTCIPGPEAARYASGARLIAAYPIPPLVPGVGLSLCFQRYGEQIDVSVLACRDRLLMPSDLLARIHEGLGELLALSRISQGSKREPFDLASLG